MQLHHWAIKSRVGIRWPWGRPAATSLMVLLITSCAIGQGARPSPLQPIDPVTDNLFAQEYRDPFVAWEQPIEEARVAVACDASRTIWAAGPWGVRRLTEGKWQAPDGDELNGPAFALAAEKDVVRVAAWNGLYRIEKHRLVRDGLEVQPLGLVRLSDGRLFAGGPRGIWERKGGDWKTVAG